MFCGCQEAKQCHGTLSFLKSKTSIKKKGQGKDVFPFLSHDLSNANMK